MKDLIQRLEDFQKWRRGDDTIDQLEPKQLGEDIDTAIQLLKKMNRVIHNTTPSNLHKLIWDWAQGDCDLLVDPSNKEIKILVAKILGGQKDWNTIDSEISPERLIKALKPADSYILCALEDAGENSLTLERGDTIAVFKVILRRILDTLEDECDGDRRKAMQIADDVHEEVTYDWLGEE